MTSCFIAGESIKLMLASVFNNFAKFRPGTTGSFNRQVVGSIIARSLHHLFDHYSFVSMTIHYSPPDGLLRNDMSDFHVRKHKLIVHGRFRAARVVFRASTITVSMNSTVNNGVQLHRPARTVTRIILARSTVGHTFRTSLIQRRLRKIASRTLAGLSNNRPLGFQSIRVALRPSRRIVVSTGASLPGGQSIPVRLATGVAIRGQQHVLFSRTRFLTSSVPDRLQSLSTAVARKFSVVLGHVISLRQFGLSKIVLQIGHLRAGNGRLVFDNCTRVSRFPNVT